MTSHVFFLPSYFTGPQHSMKRFRNFVQRNIDDGDMTGSKRFATKRFLLGWVYFAIHIIFNMIVSIIIISIFWNAIERAINCGKIRICHIFWLRSVNFQAPVDYIKEEEFQAMPFWKMSFYYTIWVKGILSKYIGAWLLAEGAVILSGKNFSLVCQDLLPFANF